MIQKTHLALFLILSFYNAYGMENIQTKVDLKRYELQVRALEKSLEGTHTHYVLFLAQGETHKTSYSDAQRVLTSQIKELDINFLSKQSQSIQHTSSIKFLTLLTLCKEKVEVLTALETKYLEKDPAANANLLSTQVKALYEKLKSTQLITQ